MKVSGPGPISSQTSSRPRQAQGGFSVPGGTAAAPPATASLAGVAGVGSVEALLALQAAEGPEERRRRAMRRGGGLLDRLDALKLAMLSGEDGASALQALAHASAEQRDQVDDPGLADLLDHIDTRAAVELAKVRYRTSA
nr:flagellar assembly protein FliX [Brevundimonas sp.]